MTFETSGGSARKNNGLGDDLVESVKSMHVANKTPSDGWASPTRLGKERVSFGMDMSTDDNSMGSSGG
jgi:hypothetical protein